VVDEAVLAAEQESPRPLHLLGRPCDQRVGEGKEEAGPGHRVCRHMLRIPY